MAGKDKWKLTIRAPVHTEGELAHLAEESPAMLLPVRDSISDSCAKRSSSSTRTTISSEQQQQEDSNTSNEGPHKCTLCGKTFAVLARLTRHYRIHTGERPFACEQCGKRFSVKENLSVHRRIHTKERPYRCLHCGRGFEHSGKLHRHMRIHTGERPHQCRDCGKTFIQSGQLVIHMRSHTGEKPYVCSVCSKGFTCSKQLKVHSRTHTGERPYSCDVCGKTFAYNHVLKLHQMAHLGEKLYKCTLCSSTFGSKKTLEAHLKSHASAQNVPASPPLPQAGTSGTNEQSTGSLPTPAIGPTKSPTLPRNSSQARNLSTSSNGQDPLRRVLIRSHRPPSAGSLVRQSALAAPGPSSLAMDFRSYFNAPLFHFGPMRQASSQMSLQGSAMFPEPQAPLAAVVNPTHVVPSLPPVENHARTLKVPPVPDSSVPPRKSFRFRHHEAATSSPGSAESSANFQHVDHKATVSAHARSTSVIKFASRLGNGTYTSTY